MDKLRIYAGIELASKDISALNKALGIPPEDKRQPDLQYVTSVFVSTGMNLNGAFFMPSEIYKARNSITSKPLDIEHDESKVVGHLFSRAFMDKEGRVMDMSEAIASTDIDTLSFDVATGMYVYKARFPEVAEDIKDGRYCVSMECYYRDFDVILGDILIPRVEAEKIGLVSKINRMVKVVDDGKNVGTFKVGRVLRDILFSGCGLVENPANPDSLILEAASEPDMTVDLAELKEKSETHTDDKHGIVVDMHIKKDEKVMHSATDLASMHSSYGGCHHHRIGAGMENTIVGGGHSHVVFADDVPEGVIIYIEKSGEHKHDFDPDTGMVGEEKEHTHSVILEIADKQSDKWSVVFAETSPPLQAHGHMVSYISGDVPGVVGGDHGDGNILNEDMGQYMDTDTSGSHRHTIKINGTTITTITIDDVIPHMKDKMMPEEASTSDAFICASFRRFVYKSVSQDPKTLPQDPTPGMVPQEDSIPIPAGGGGEGTVGPSSQVIHENWCTLFDTACTSEGGVATHPDCLRVILNRTTKELVSDYVDKIYENRRTVPAIEQLAALIDDAKKLIDKE